MKFSVQTDNITLLTLIGVVLGLSVRMCIPDFPWWGMFFSTFCITFMLSFRAGQTEALKSALFAGGLAAFLALSSWLSAYVLGDGSFITRKLANSSMGGFFYGAMVFVISTAFFMAYSVKGRWNADYRLLDQYAWDRPIIYTGAWLFVGVLWVILLLWVGLFQVLGITIFKEMFIDPWFICASVGGAFALGATLLVRQEGIIASTRSLVESLLGVLTPVVALLVVLFLVVLPVTGLDPIWNTGRTSMMIAFLIVLAICLINATIRQEGEVAAPLYALSVRVLALALPVLALIALWAIMIRIGQYGLTPRRMDAMILMGIASLYAVTYAVSVGTRWRMGWEDQIRRVNVVNALVVLAVSAVMVTPIINLRAISAWQQKNALLSGRLAVETFDFGSLKYKMGNPGKAALEDIRAGAQDHPQGTLILAKLAEVDKSRSYYEVKRGARGRAASEQRVLTESEIRDAYDVRPAGDPLPKWLPGAMKTQAYELDACKKRMNDAQKTMERCVIVLADVYGDKEGEALVFGTFGDPRLYFLGAENVVAEMKVGVRMDPKAKRADVINGVRAAALSGQVQVLPADYRMLKIGGTGVVILPTQ